MSTESVSELPTHYGEVQKDGTRVERPQGGPSRQRSSQDDSAPLVRTLPPSGSMFVAPFDAFDQDAGNRASRDETRTSRDIGDSRPSRQKSTLGRNDYGRSLRMRRRYDDYERYSDYDDEYDDPPQPRRIRDRPYFPGGDELGPLCRPSRASRQGGGGYPRDRRRRSLEEYDEPPRTPRGNYSQKKQSVAHNAYTYDEEGERQEHKSGGGGGVYPTDAPTAINRQINFKDLTREQKREIMRLPWIQWMDSSTKNRECIQLSISWLIITDS